MIGFSVSSCIISGCQLCNDFVHCLTYEMLGHWRPRTGSPAPNVNEGEEHWAGVLLLQESIFYSRKGHEGLHLCSHIEHTNSRQYYT